MSVGDPSTFDSRLLDLHLGHLTAAEQAELRQRIQADPRLAAQDAALAEVFRALSSVRHVAAPRGLQERVIARVRTAPRVVQPPRSRATVTAQNERIIRVGQLRDIVAVAALIVLAVGIGVPGTLHLRERQQRLGCSANLQQLGFGVQQYASMFGALPFTGFDERARWLPTNDPDLVNVPNRRHMYPLLRLHFVADPRLFICPSQKDVPMPAAEIARRDDFLEPRNVSFAYPNMAGTRPSANDTGELPILSDDNPLFADGQPLVDMLRRRGGNPAEENSRAHAGAGQNLLTLSGHVKWATTPRAGLNGDNIWTLNNVERYTGREGPTSATDSHLLK